MPTPGKHDPEKQLSDAEDKAGQNLDVRLHNLGKRLSQVVKKHEEKSKPDKNSRFSQTTAFGRAIRLPAEFASGVIVGVGLGWLCDKTFDISPWGIIIFVIIGFCAGLLNLLRATGHFGSHSRKHNKDDP